MHTRRPNARVRILAAFVLTGLLAAPPAVAMATADAAREFVNAKARQLFMKHRRAIKALESTLRNPAYKAFFQTGDAASRAAYRYEIAQTTLKVQRYFDVEEMCLIDREGNELVRMVDGHVDPNLSTEEEQNIFFEPAFALPEGDVLVSPVYRSPDNGQWVIAYVTPIAVEAENVGLLHYEQEVAKIAGDLLEDVDSPGQSLVAFDETGRVLFDSRTGGALSLPDGAPLPSRVEGLDLDDYIAAAERGTLHSGQAVALRKVRGWTLVALQR